MMSNRNKYLIAGILLSAIAVTFYAVWFAGSNIEGWYKVRDTYVDSTGREKAVILFVEVPEYDSARMIKAAEYEADVWSEKPLWEVSTNRTLLFHFYQSADTLPLTDYMIDELAYTNPSIDNPGELLQVVPHGWVVRMNFPVQSNQFDSVEMRTSQFYKPRPGVKARDLRSR